MTDWMPALLLLPAWLYLFWIALLYVGFRKQRSKPRPVSISINEGVTLIIPTRDEEANIGCLLTALLQQRFPLDQIEVIVIDDHSQDRTREVVKAFAHAHPQLRIALMIAEEHPDNPKKRALQQAVAQARGKFILTLDADVRVGPRWLEGMTAHLSGGARMVAGPVRMDAGKSFFGALQALEFLSLVGSGLALAGLRRPIMANGANLAFTPESFQMAYSESGLSTLASGDDVQLLASLQRNDPGRVVFATASETFVDTPAAPDLETFLQQRIRWASKARHTKDFVNSLVALWVFAYNGLLIFLALAAVWEPRLALVALVLWLVKLVADYPLLTVFSAWSRQRGLLRVYLPLQLVYSFYVVGVGWAGLFGRYRWKGRRFRGQ